MVGQQRQGRRHVFALHQYIRRHLQDVYKRQVSFRDMGRLFWATDEAPEPYQQQRPAAQQARQDGAQQGIGLGVQGQEQGGGCLLYTSRCV